jgi:hypothetical protein
MKTMTEITYTHCRPSGKEKKKTLLFIKPFAVLAAISIWTMPNSFRYPELEGKFYHSVQTAWCLPHMFFSPKHQSPLKVGGVIYSRF